MKILVFLLALVLTAPAFAANNGQAGQNEDKKEAEKKEITAPESEAGVYKCEYYTIKLPTDWQAILPPTDTQGQVSAVFAKDGSNPSVTITIARTGGYDLKNIADIFAQQFQAPKKPVLKNGQYIFSYNNNNVPTQVWVAASTSLFMITAIGGNQKEGLDFLKTAFTDIRHPDLFPK